MPDLLTAVKLLAGSTVEIAAASVGERSLVKAVLKIEEDGKSLDSVVEIGDSKILKATAEAVEGAEEGAVVENEEELKSAEDAEAPAAEDDSSAPVLVAADEEEQEEAAACPPEEATTSAPIVEEIGEAEPEDQSAPEEVFFSPTEASPEDVGPAEEAAPAEEAVLTAAETSVDEAAAEAPAEEPTETAAAVDTVQLAAASVESGLGVHLAPEPQSTPEAPVHKVKSCHCAPSAAEDVAPPVALGEQLVDEAATEMTEESKEAVLESKKLLLHL